MSIFHIGDTNTYMVFISASSLEGTFEQFQGRNQTPGVLDHLAKIVMYAMCSSDKTSEREVTSVLI